MAYNSLHRIWNEADMKSFLGLSLAAATVALTLAPLPASAGFCFFGLVIAVLRVRQCLHLLTVRTARRARLRVLGFPCWRSVMASIGL